MKKSLLLVGAFLTVAAMAQAKEIVPAPVVVEEAPVQVVEKEVIVYRDREPQGFRPNGYVDIMEKLKNLITKIMVSAITMEEHN